MKLTPTASDCMHEIVTRTAKKLAGRDGQELQGRRHWLSGVARSMVVEAGWRVEIRQDDELHQLRLTGGQQVPLSPESATPEQRQAPQPRPRREKEPEAAVRQLDAVLEDAFAQLAAVAADGP
ncbi:hypothetical protein BOX15_Mlig031055g3 [Macrostomum lignano]|uniref:Uncharacterized protein n=1 Tax=Macrostomum lignano TaxID=282301 RepID=A0A267GNC2_9PLAT|nr:hypothetical protein BOX15_Mlig031055g6 [Macrostomum lignano]PAA87516.1 hypothetical protein BOX15_Mlig031055g3 [Macrostomum lignano]